MSDKNMNFNNIYTLIDKIKNGEKITEEEKNFIKKTLDEHLDEIVEDTKINDNLHLLLIEVGDKAYAESIFKRDFEGGFEITDENGIPTGGHEIGIGITVVNTFKEFGDKEYLKEILLNPDFFFTSYQKQLLLEEIGDEKLIDKFIEEKSLGLWSFHVANLIENKCKGNPEGLRKYLINQSINLSSETKMDWLIRINDKDLMEKFIRDTSLGLSPLDRAIVIIKKCDGNVDELKKYFFDESLELGSDTKTQILIEINDEELIDKYIRDTTLGLSSENIAKLIRAVSINDISKLKQYLFDVTIGLEIDDIIFLLKNLPNEQDASQILRDQKLNIDLKSKIKIATELKDNKFIKEAIEREENIDFKIDLMNEVYDEELIYDFLKKNIDKTTSFNLLVLIKKINDPKMLEEFKDIVEKGDESGELVEHIVLKLNDADYTKKWESRRVEIENVNELTLKDIEENEQIKYVVMKNPLNPLKNYYSRNEYIEIRKVLDEILKGIPIPKKGDFKSEFTAFKMVFKRLSHIEYDEYAVSTEGELDKKLQRTCRNLYGGLVEGTCVCAGYAEILEQALKSLGIEVKQIGGDTNEDEGHVWNQVKLGGKWFNCDFTASRYLGKKMKGINIYKALKTNEQFKSYEKYCISRTKDEEKCDTKIEQLILGKYVRNMAKSFGINEIKQCFKNLEEELKKFKDRLLHKQTDER